MKVFKRLVLGLFVAAFLFLAYINVREFQVIVYQQQVIQEFSRFVRAGCPFEQLKPSEQ
jgi:hypothetical protein